MTCSGEGRLVSVRTASLRYTCPDCHERMSALAAHELGRPSGHTIIVVQPHEPRSAAA